MKMIIFLFLLFKTFCLLVPAQENTPKTPLENYLQGHATGNGEFHRKAFYPEARLLFVRDGKFTQLTSDEYIKAASGKPADDESKRKRRIEMVDAAENAPIGKVILDYPTAYFVDYFALLKINGEWKIVNKSFHAQRRSDSAEKIGFKTTAEEMKAVAVPLENYIRAGETSDGNLFRKAFYPGAMIMSFSNGNFTRRSAEEYASVYTGEPEEDEPKPKTSFQVIDIAGNAAIAKVIIDFPTVKFTDYMTLLKIDGEWKIVNKTSSTKAKK